jgi:effector-binding domain-containing protein
MSFWTPRTRPAAAWLAVALMLASGTTLRAQSETPAPDAPPAAESPAAEPPSVIPAPPPIIQPAEVFGDAVELPSQTVIYFKGKGNLESDYPTLRKAFKTVEDYLDSTGIKATGHPMLIYREGDDGFEFEAAIPVAEPPATPPGGELAVGKSPAGHMLKFVHQGAYAAMDMTYEAITNFLDEKGLDADELFVEEYVTDPVTTTEDNLVINIFVPAH